MADNKRWFKVWTSILSDPGLQVIPLEDWGRWIKLMALAAMHGENGNVTVPVSYLQQQLCIKDLMCITLPNIELESNNITVTVTIKNWSKYQVFSESYERVQRFRERQKDVTVTNVTDPLPDKIRRDKKRRDKNTTSSSFSNHDFDSFWTSYPRKIGKAAAQKKWDTLKKSGKLPSLEIILQAIDQQNKSEDWKKEFGQFIPHPTTWLNQERWTDEIKEITWMDRVKSQTS